MKPGEKHVLSSSTGDVLHLSQACLQVSGKGKTDVKATVQGGTFTLTCLEQGKLDFDSFDLFFRPEETVFSIEGACPVTLLGYVEASEGNQMEPRGRSEPHRDTKRHLEPDGEKVSKVAKVEAATSLTLVEEEAKPNEESQTKKKKKKRTKASVESEPEIIPDRTPKGQKSPVTKAKDKAIIQDEQEAGEAAAMAGEAALAAEEAESEPEIIPDRTPKGQKDPAIRAKDKAIIQDEQEAGEAAAIAGEARLAAEEAEEEEDKPPANAPLSVSPLVKVALPPQASAAADLVPADTELSPSADLCMDSPSSDDRVPDLKLPSGKEAAVAVITAAVAKSPKLQALARAAAALVPPSPKLTAASPKVQAVAAIIQLAVAKSPKLQAQAKAAARATESNDDDTCGEEEEEEEEESDA